MSKPTATIDEPGGYTLNIYERLIVPSGETRWFAERVAPDGSITTPQNNMTAEECIRYLAHVAYSYAYEASKR
jgi:hypothetical protein